MIYSVNPIVDMIRTATNAAGQIVAPSIVVRSQGLLDDNVLNAPTPNAPAAQPVANNRVAQPS